MKRIFSAIVIMLTLSCVLTLSSCFMGNGGSTATTTNPTDEPSQDHKHSYTATVIDVTCTESGYTVFACSCGTNYKANYIDPTGHTYNSEVTLPTCTEQGYTTYTCDCGDSYVDDYVEIDPSNHNSGDWVIDKPATCTENGTNSKYCIACGEKTDSAVTFRTGHVMSITVIQELSCTENGIVRHECTAEGCGYSYEITTQAEHNMQLEEKVDATCTLDGHILYGCTKCDYEEITVMYGGHSYTSEITKEPTQKKTGEITYTCSYCNDSYTEEIPMIKQGVYALLIEDSAPWRTNTNAELLTSLVNQGYIAYWDRLYSSQLDSADLSKYGIIIIANDQNSTTYQNIVANKNNLQIFARDGGVLLYGACDAGWSFGNIGAALLEGVEKGNYYSYRNYIVNAEHPIVTGALTDGKSLTNELLYHNYASHTYFTNLPEGSNIILQDANGNPTLVEYEVGSGHVIVSGLTWEHSAKYQYNLRGSYSKTAYDDLIIYATTLINACEHEYKENGSQEVSCTESGYTLYTCSACGFTYKDNIVKPLGHNVEKWTQTKAPTCTEAGEKNGTCTVCGEMQTRRVEAYGHTESEWIVDTEPTCTVTGSQHIVCEICGETISTATIPTLDHTESEWIVDKEATETENGSKHIECTVCGTTLKTEAFKINYSVGLEYLLNEDGQSYSLKGIGTCTDTDIVIPSAHDGLPVTGIVYTPFSECLVTSVTIPDTVTSIGDYVFLDCYLLTSIEVDENNAYYKSIDGNFYSKDGKTLIQYAVGKQDVEFTIPDSVTSICNDAFYYCESLASVIIPDSVTSIGSSAFCGCTSLTSIEIPDSVTSIGGGAFDGCTSLTSVVISKSMTNIGNFVFARCRSLESIEIPNSVTSIGEYTFHDCTSLTSIVIPNSVTSIGDEAFLGCYALIEVCNKSELNIISDSSENGSVGRYAKHIIRDETETYLKYVGEYLFYDDGKNAYLMKYLGKDTEIVLPEYKNERTYEIYRLAFYANPIITKIIIPDSVTSIGYEAFKYCTSLTSVVIADSVTSIGYQAFYNCTSLTSVVIGDSVRSIGDYAFSKCKALISITIPDFVTSIGMSVFAYCSKLTIYCEAESKPAGWNSTWNYSSRPVVWGYTGE